MSKVVTQLQAAIHCGVSPSTFRYWLRKRPDLRVACRRMGIKGWEINLDELDRWRNRHGIMKPREAHARELSHLIRDQWLTQQANLLEIKVEQLRGSLVNKKEVEDRINAAIAFLNNQLYYYPAHAGRMHAFTNEQTVKITEDIEWTRDRTIGMLREILTSQKRIC